MDVTPQLLHDVEFREAKRGGYNTQDVDEFLERLAVALERQDVTVKEARQRIEAAEARAAEAERRAVHAEQSAGDSSVSDETLKRTLVLAQRTADAAIREAEDQAARTLSAAQEQSSRLLAEAEEIAAKARAEAEDEARAAHEEARARVLEEMHELESARDQLRADVDVLERYLDGQRERVRRSVHDLQRMLDDPESLREAELPVVSDVATPAAPAPAAARQPLVAAPPEDDLVDDDAPADWLPDEDAWESATDVPAPVSVFDAEDDDLDDVGPPTQPVDVLAGDSDDDDDAYLAELRKAMTDDTPLGPRDDPGGHDLYEPDAGRARFGRRR
jgi:DivIVA domain-containing protein